MRFPDVTPDIGVPGPIRSAFRAAGRVRVPSVAGTYSPRGSWSGPGRSRETVGQAVRDPDTWISLGTMFMPGPPGKGRFVGKLGYDEVMQMKSLGNVRTRKIKPETLEAMEEMGVSPERLAFLASRRIRDLRHGSDVPIGATRKWLTGGRRGSFDPIIQQMIDLFGYRTQNPMETLEQAVAGRRPPTPGVSQVAAHRTPVEAMLAARSKLGTYPDQLPNWAYPKGVQKMFGPEGRDLPDRMLLRGMSEEMSDDQLITLAKIIETINRRGRGGSPRTELGEYGGN